LSNKKMIESIRKQKHLFLFESVLFSIMLFTIPYAFTAEKYRNLSWDLIEPFMAWSCGMAALGYAKQYLNRNSKFRKLANEAIYPFYLLHQPVIVVIAYFMVQWDMAIVWKVILITLSSFVVTISVYWFLIRPFNVVRFIFGMKWLPRDGHKTLPQGQVSSIPVVVKNHHRKAS